MFSHYTHSARLGVVCKCFLTLVCLLLTSNAQEPATSHATEAKTLLEQLNDPNPGMRAAAADALGRIGEKAKAAAPALVEALKDQPQASKFENDYVRHIAANALVKIGLPAVPALIEALRDGDVNVRGGAAYALGRIGLDAKAAVPELVEALKDRPEASKSENDYVRDAAANALVNIGSAAVPTLIEALQRQDADVSGGAAYALGRIGPRAKEAVPGLIEALKAQHEYVKGSAADALGRIGAGAKAAVPALIEALHDRSGEVRSGAAYALGQIGARDAIPVLINALKDQHEHVRASAAYALVRIGPDSIPKLIESLKDQHEGTRGGAAHVLGQFGPGAKDAVPTLIEALNAQDEYVRDRSADALGRIGAEDAVAPLIKILTNENDNVRSSAADALGRIGTPAMAAVPELIRALNAPEDYVRSGAADALGSIATSLARARDVAAIDQLKSAQQAVQNSSDPDVRKQADGIRKAIDYLESIPEEGILAWIERHPMISVISALVTTYVVLLLISLTILWLRPLWVLHISDRLSISVPLPARWLGFSGDLKIPLSYCVAIGLFRFSNRALDEWTKTSVSNYRLRFDTMATVREHQVHVPVASSLDSQPDQYLTGSHLRRYFSQGRTCVLIHGEGGSGKTSLACQIAKWAMSSDPIDWICDHLMLPVFIEPDFAANGAPLTEQVRGQLQAFIAENVYLSKELLLNLLRSRRILVVMDHFSELSRETKNKLRPGQVDFPIYALVVTSRNEENFGNIPMTRVSTQRIEASKLPMFMDSYLKAKESRDQFDGEENLELCRHLVGIARNRELSVLIAKLYAEQMIALKRKEPTVRLKVDDLAKNLPDLMLRYLNKVVGQPSTDGPDERTVHHFVKIIAWECLRQSFRPSAARIEDIVKGLPSEDQVKQTLDYLEQRLLIVSTVGNGRDKMWITLDPLAEYLAAIHLVEQYRGNDGLWHLFFDEAKLKEGYPKEIKGFLLAVLDCCHTIGTEESYKVPGWVSKELARLTGGPQNRTHNNPEKVLRY